MSVIQYCDRRRLQIGGRSSYSRFAVNNLSSLAEEPDVHFIHENKTLRKKKHPAPPPTKIIQPKRVIQTLNFTIIIFYSFSFVPFQRALSRVHRSSTQQSSPLQFTLFPVFSSMYRNFSTFRIHIMLQAKSSVYRITHNQKSNQTLTYKKNEEFPPKKTRYQNNNKHSKFSTK